MKKLSYLLLIIFLSSLAACDNDQINRPKTAEARTMIIGGVPVHDRDYRLPQPQIIAQDIQQR
ncbi:NF038215 family lipoprotein [Acinetobacter sp. HR7]|uniref:NF038215 family lipoprotein n=1 Tax=Acinetobacter sp. HR7 TaxID=1509403 RepID=UPI00053815DA|nr:NF038215 family lipoprotein [Acinetobacter sp. HR7]KGT48273.1 hypothetical protein GW12_07000 [Acinetobacter sp. HR7]